LTFHRDFAAPSPDSLPKTKTKSRVTKLYTNLCALHTNGELLLNGLFIIDYLHSCSSQKKINIIGIFMPSKTEYDFAQSIFECSSFNLSKKKYSLYASVIS